MPAILHERHPSIHMHQADQHSLVETCHAVQLPNTLWKSDVLLLHIHEYIEKYKEKLTNLRRGNVAQGSAQAVLGDLAQKT
jgi:hypothetical protein